MSSPSNNEVQVYCDDITQMTFPGESYLAVPYGEATSGAPTAQKSSDVWTISFLCDRDGNEGVADKFNNDWCRDAKHEYCPSAKRDSQPSELNFAFGMACVFTLNGTTYPIHLYFGQGGQGVHNNWWFGSLLITESQNLVIRDSSGQQVAVYALSGGNSDLVLTKI